MANVNYYELAILKGFERSDVAKGWITKKIKPLSVSALCLVKRKILCYPKYPRALLDSSTESILMTAFSIADCKYARDNQRNDAISNATRTSTGGNGGRILEPVRKRISLLGQAFEPEFKMCESLKLPKRRMAPIMELLGKRTCDEQSGMSFA